MNPEELIAHADFVHSLARSLVLDEHRAADVSQDAWLAALLHPPAEKRTARSWLSKVLRNFAFTLHRRESRRMDRERIAARREDLPSTEEVVEKMEIRRLLIDAVLNLNEPYRSTLIIRFYDGLAPKDIASRYDLPLETVRTRIKRGLGQLRERLDHLHDGDRNKWCLSLAPLAGLKTVLPALQAGSLTPVTSGVIAVSAKMKILSAAVVVLGLAISLFLLKTILEESPQDDRFAHTTFDPPGEAGNANPGEESAGILSDEKVKITPHGQEVRLSGRVVSKEEGRGISGASVKMNLLPFREDLPSVECVTDSSGGFTLQTKLPDHVQVTAFHIGITASGLMNLETSLPRLADGNVRDWGNFYLGKNREHLLRIKDETGRPVPGARLELYKRFQGLVLVKTGNDNGIVRITDQELYHESRSFPISLRVIADGFSTFFMESLVRSQMPEEIVLEKAGFISLRVVDSKTSLGIPGARLSLISPRQSFIPRPSYDSYAAILNAESDASGNVRIPKISCSPGTNFRIWVQAEGYYQSRWPIYPRRSTVDSPETVLVDPFPRFITVRVMDKRTQDPIPGASVRLGSYDKAETDEEGCFKIPLVKGTLRLAVSKPGYDSFRGKYDEWRGLLGDDPTSPRREVKQVAIGGVFWIQLNPREGARAKIHVMVQDDFGRPLTGARVRIDHYPENSPTSSGGGVLFTAEEGSVLHEDLYLTPELEVHLLVSREGYVPSNTKFIFSPAQDCISKQIVLHKGMLFQKVRVVDRNGEPLNDRLITASLTMSDGNTVSVTGSSDEHGLCSLNLPFFDHGVVRSGVTRGIHSDQDKKITFDDVLHGREIVITVPKVLALSSRIRGVIRDESGLPVEGIAVRPRLRDEDSLDFNTMPLRTASARSDAEGRFEIKVFKNQVYRLQLYRSGGKKHWLPKEDLNAVPDGSDVTITMIQGTSVELDYSEFLSSEKGKRFHSTWLENEKGRWVIPEIRDDQDSCAVFKGIPPGKIRAVIGLKGNELIRTPLYDVEAGMHVRMVAPVEK